MGKSLFNISVNIYNTTVLNRFPVKSITFKMLNDCYKGKLLDNM